MTNLQAVQCVCSRITHIYATDITARCPHPSCGHLIWPMLTKPGGA